MMKRNSRLFLTIFCLIGILAILAEVSDISLARDLRDVQEQPPILTPEKVKIKHFSPNITKNVVSASPTVVDNVAPRKNIALRNKLYNLQLPFIENQGQIKDESIRFYANTFAGNAYITNSGEIIYGIVKKEAKKDVTGLQPHQDAHTPENFTFQTTAIKERIVAKPQVRKR
jgi:hypothetical protein